MAGTNPSATRPYWPVPESKEPLGPLTDDTTADVCIVGAGIAGLTTAYIAVR
jgi:hypothetical protein